MTYDNDKLINSIGIALHRRNDENDNDDADDDVDGCLMFHRVLFVLFTNKFHK